MPGEYSWEFTLGLSGSDLVISEIGKIAYIYSLQNFHGNIIGGVVREYLCGFCAKC